MKNIFQRCDTKMLIKTNLTPATAIGPDDFQDQGVALMLGRTYIETRGFNLYRPTLFKLVVQHAQKGRSTFSIPFILLMRTPCRR